MPSSSDHSRHSGSNPPRNPLAIRSPGHPPSSSASTVIPIPSATSPQLDLTPYSDASPPRAIHRGPSQVDQREQDVQAALHFSRARSGTYERHPDDDLAGPRRPSTLITPQNLPPPPPPDPRFFLPPQACESSATPTRLTPGPLFDLSLELNRSGSSDSLESSPGAAFIDHRHHQHRHRPSTENSPAYFRSLLIHNDPRPKSVEERGVSPRRENESLIDHRDPVGWVVPERAPAGRGLAGMLPHFPYPFDFGALEAFAVSERGKASPASVASEQRILPGSQSEEDPGVRRRKIGFVEGQVGSKKEQAPNHNRRLSECTGPITSRQRKLALFEGEQPASKKGPEPAKPPPPREDEERAKGERPYRFSFYSNALPSTIHARSLGEIPGPGERFEDLFVGRSRRSEEEPGASSEASSVQANGKARSGVLMRTDEDAEANSWWLDVLSPTDEEMKLLSKVFGIHPLTTEDIQMEETREKIELFRNYYLVCFRSFDQDPYSPTYLEPLNMYIIVFREGTLSFHFRGTPHPQNVRRRIKQLKDYINVTSDWISYALIDDITDAFGPLIQSIEYEVDSIDELVLILKDAEQTDMLRRIGTCRKKVMGLLRLMGNKADVVKGLAKRCNENWSVAPKSDIGLYLSDIQDHLVTMTQNLNHYEKILSRSHSNYLAQISIEMTDANNQINDVLSKLTALGSILIPMNLVTGLWGMNVHVPGQDVAEGYAWFLSIVCGLVSFGVVGAWLTLRYFKFSKG